MYFLSRRRMWRHEASLFFEQPLQLGVSETQLWIREIPNYYNNNLNDYFYFSAF